MPFARRGSSKVGPRPYLVGTATSIAAYAQGIGANKNLIVPCDSTGKLLPPTSLIADAHQVRLLVHAWTFRNENFFLPVDFRIGDSADSTFPAQYGNAFAEYKLFFDWASTACSATAQILLSKRAIHILSSRAHSMNDAARTKRIVLSTFGSLGDINPYVGIALELKARGYHPVIAATEAYREKVEALAIDFHPVRPALSSYDTPEEISKIVEKCMDRKTGTAEIFNSLIFPYLPDIYEDLHSAVRKADLLVTHPLPLVGPIVAQKTGIPWVSSVLAPFSLFSAYDPPVGAQMPSLQKFLALSPFLSRVFLKLAKWKLAPRFEPVYRLRAELGLPPGEHPIVEGQHSPALVLALFSSVLAKPQPDWPPQTRVTGFPFYDRRGRRSDRTGLSPELVTFLDKGPPPIVFTLGSSAFWAAKNFYRDSVAAAHALGQRALLLIGDAYNYPTEPLPNGMAAFEYAPYGEVLPRARIIVHHGGIGTTGQALRAGKPMLVVPFAHDQFDNAARITRLGVGRILPRAKYNTMRAIKELSRLLKEQSYTIRATAIARHVQIEDGIRTACDAIGEQLLHHP